MKNHSTISKALRNIVAERDSYSCVLCEDAYSDIHHYIPRSQGGRDVPYNLVAVCRRHHEVLHGRYYPDFDERDHDELDYCLAEYLGDFYAEDDDFYAYIASEMQSRREAIQRDALDLAKLVEDSAAEYARIYRELLPDKPD